MNSNHPCFNRAAHTRFGRIHLPVAPECNIHCGFCDRRFSCVNESRPGVTARVLTPEEALGMARSVMEKNSNISVIGIAGPGDPLANPEQTMRTLALVHQSLPDVLLCLSTNGLGLPEHAENLAGLGVRHLTVTVNAVDPEIGSQIYLKVRQAGKVLSGTSGSKYLLERQMEGIRLAKKCGMTVKVNMVIVNGINSNHACEVARKLSGLGVDLMNCLPMLPVAGTPLSCCGEPTAESMTNIRRDAEKWLPQMRHCGRCRADSAGLLGSASILEDYCGK